MKYMDLGSESLLDFVCQLHLFTFFDPVDGNRRSTPLGGGTPNVYSNIVGNGEHEILKLDELSSAVLTVPKPSDNIHYYPGQRAVDGSKNTAMFSKKFIANYTIFGNVFDFTVLVCNFDGNEYTAGGNSESSSFTPPNEEQKRLVSSFPIPSASLEDASSLRKTIRQFLNDPYIDSAPTIPVIAPLLYGLTDDAPHLKYMVNQHVDCLLLEENTREFMKEFMQYQSSTTDVFTVGFEGLPWAHAMCGTGFDVDPRLRRIHRSLFPSVVDCDALMDTLCANEGFVTHEACGCYHPDIEAEGATDNDVLLYNVASNNFGDERLLPCLVEKCTNAKAYKNAERRKHMDCPNICAQIANVHLGENAQITGEIEQEIDCSGKTVAEFSSTYASIHRTITIANVRPVEKSFFGFKSSQSVGDWQAEETEFMFFPMEAGMPLELNSLCYIVVSDSNPRLWLDVSPISGQPKVVLSKRKDLWKNENGVQTSQWRIKHQTAIQDLEVGGVCYVSANADYRFQIERADVNKWYTSVESRPEGESVAVPGLEEGGLESVQVTLKGKTYMFRKERSEYSQAKLEQLTKTNRRNVEAHMTVTPVGSTVTYPLYLTKDDEDDETELPHLKTPLVIGQDRFTFQEDSEGSGYTFTLVNTGWPFSRIVQGCDHWNHTTGGGWLERGDRFVLYGTELAIEPTGQFGTTTPLRIENAVYPDITPLVDVRLKFKESSKKRWRFHYKENRTTMTILVSLLLVGLIYLWVV